jgi:ABC-type polysaccharide/polyol phosphate transport system ATPase subunit
MNNWVIKTEALSKEYDLSQVQSGRLIDFFTPKKKHKVLKKAVDRLSLSIERGSVVGIQGVNGSGKSTFIKLLAGITRPSSGRVQIKGKVASLLEVGTGFHPDLSGRENIFLNGSILGMTRKYIQSKYDEILAFSELEAYEDVAIKKYSTGMEMRLAFAVAIHIESDIILLDEVLAVGDPAFRQKCIRRLKQLAATSRTIIIVSHNQEMLDQLCDRMLTFESGKVVKDV